MAPIPFLKTFSFEYQVIETVSPLIRRIVARNPGPYTGPGTSTHIVGHGRVALIDPGPLLEPHIEAILQALRDETIDHILVTHTHSDHSPGAAAIQRATGAPTCGYGRHGGGRAQGSEEGADYDFVPDRVLREGDEVAGPGWRLTALETPGHSANHLAFALPEERVLFTGDHVMGWSTSVVSPPDGNMADYRRSLAKLPGREDRVYIPAHGPAIHDPQPFVAALIEHRRERSDAIRARLAAGDRSIEQIVDALYIGLAPQLKPAAARSVLAHLMELIELGQAVREEQSDGEVVFLNT